jgi:hypothetical protein
MSGGSFNYAYSRVQTFADDLEHKLDVAGTAIPHYSGSGYERTEYEPDFDDVTNARLRYIVDQARKFAEVMRAVEWLYSSDSGPEYVKEAMDAFK